MRRVALFGFFGALLLLVAWWFLFISPRNTQIDEAKSDLIAAQSDESRLRGQIAALQDISDSEVEYLAGIGTLETLIPAEPLLDQFIEEINELAIATGVELSTLAPSVPSLVQESADLRQITVVTNLEGTFFDVMGFLFGLTEMDRLVRVDGVTLSSVTDEAGNTVLTVTLEMNLFTLSDLVPIIIEAPPTDDGDDATDGGEEA